MEATSTVEILLQRWRLFLHTRATLRAPFPFPCPLGPLWSALAPILAPLVRACCQCPLDWSLLSSKTHCFMLPSIILPDGAVAHLDYFTSPSLCSLRLCQSSPACCSAKPKVRHFTNTIIQVSTLTTQQTIYEHGRPWTLVVLLLHNLASAYLG